MTISTMPTRILTLLDGSSLAATSCASSQLRNFSVENQLWKEICSATWESINDARVRQVISTFPAYHRSFFSHSFPLLDNFKPSNRNPHLSYESSTLISAVDIYYKDKIIFSRVHETGLMTEMFLTSSFWVDLLNPTETISTPIQHDEGETETLPWLAHLEENLSLSWIVIDPNGKPAGNISTRRPVRVRWTRTAGEVQLLYSTIMAGDGRPGSKAEFVECRLAVLCSGVGKGEVELEEVKM